MQLKCELTSMMCLEGVCILNHRCVHTQWPLVNWNDNDARWPSSIRRYAGADTNQHSKCDKRHKSQLSWQPKETWVAKNNNCTQHHPCPLFTWLCNTRYIMQHRTYYSLHWSCKHRSCPEPVQEWCIHKIGLKEYTKNKLGQAVQQGSLCASFSTSSSISLVLNVFGLGSTRPQGRM